MTLLQLFEETCRRRGDAIALRRSEIAFTFSDLREYAARIAGSLQARGIRAGDPVAVFLPNRSENVFAHFGIQFAGAVRVPVNAAYTAREAAHPIEAAKCKLVVTDPTRRALVPPGVPTVIVDELLEGDPVAPADVRPDSIAMICFTSGTTSKPKMVPLTHGNLESNIRGLVDAWEWTEKDVLLLCLPLMHLHGLANGLNGWIATGCTLVLQDRFDVDDVLGAIERDRATMFFGVPAMYHKLLDAPPSADFSSMRLWVSGSAQLDRTVEERFEARFGRPIVNRYGMTETVMITANPATNPRRGSVGRALPGVELRIAGNGEILVRGPNVGKVDVDPEGWFHTGDLGRLDDGWLSITGRAKDLIICGGTNIAPMEIEEVLLQHPDIAEAAVFAGADPALGEVPCAVVVPRTGHSVRSEDLLAWSGERMAKFKRLRSLHISADPLPRNAMQKLDRKRVKEIYGQ